MADEPLRDDATVDAVPRRIAVHHFSKDHAALSTEFDCRGVLGVLEGLLTVTAVTVLPGAAPNFVAGP